MRTDKERALMTLGLFEYVFVRIQAHGDQHIHELKKLLMELDEEEDDPNLSGLITSLNGYCTRELEERGEPRD